MVMNICQVKNGDFSEKMRFFATEGFSCVATEVTETTEGLNYE
jgi:hypothetical protein